MTTRFAILLAAACCASPLGAQPSSTAAPASFGVGLDQSYRLTLAIALGPTLRLQPEAGFFRASSVLPGYVVGNASGDAKMVQSNLHLGVGLYFVRSFARGGGEPVLIYGGPRAGAELQRESVGTISANQTDWWVGAALGGEYFLGRHFSLGAEAQVTKTFPGNLSGGSDSGGAFSLSLTTMEIETRGVFVIRLYPF